MATPNEHHIVHHTLKVQSYNHKMIMLVPKALFTQLHVKEDDYMILRLGKDKFVELSIHNT